VGKRGDGSISASRKGTRGASSLTIDAPTHRGVVAIFHVSLGRMNLDNLVVVAQP
jgi:hypothetical protein